MRHIYLVFAVMFLAANIACAASFDCDKASTKVEKMICTDAELSKLDEQLDKAYSKVLKESSDLSALKQQQRTWLKKRNECADTECLKNQYQRRVAVLANLKEQIIKPSTSNSSLSEAVDVCDIYKRNISLIRDLEKKCERKIHPDYAEVIKRPNWKPLDLWENRKLTALAQKFLEYGNTKRINTVFDNSKDIDDTARTQLKLHGMTLMSAKVDIDNDGVSDNLIRFQNGICSLANYSYTTAILVLDKSGESIDVTKSQLLYPDIWINPKTGKRIAIRKYHYVTYSAFSLAGKTYFDRAYNDGLLELYALSEGQTKTICKFKLME